MPPQWRARDAAGSSCRLPLSGNSDLHAHAPPFGLAKGLGGLDDQSVDEKKRHARFKIIEQRLQGRLVDFENLGKIDISARCLRAIELDLEERTLPPAFLTATPTRSCSAAPATVTVGPSRKGDPLTTVSAPDSVAAKGFFRPIQAIKNFPRISSPHSFGPRYRRAQRRQPTSGKENGAIAEEREHASEGSI